MQTKITTPSKPIMDEEDAARKASEALRHRLGLLSRKWETSAKASVAFQDYCKSEVDTVVLETELRTLRDCARQLRDAIKEGR